ncbi:MAG: MATE family efflux transporter [Verrucomicrobia bacterium]|nr:MATE family efflux transporter [Verrucomicrobiota bacterium]
MSDTPQDTTDRSTAVSLWQVVISAIRGENRDYTTETLNRAVILLAIPMVLEMVMESIFALADVFWVSHLGSDAVAVVGITESMMYIVYAVAVGLSMAGTAIVARRIGEKDPDRAASAAVQLIVVALCISAVIGMFGGFFAKDILRLMGGNDHVVEIGTPFTTIMLGGNATAILIFAINAIFRGAGDAAIAMRTLWFANAINILLGPCLVFGLGPFPKLGVTGAAVATTIGRGCGVLFQLFQLVARDSRVRIRLRHFHFELDALGQMLRLAGNGTLQNLVTTASWIGFVRIISQSGSAALAGYTIAMRVVIFALLPAWGLSNAGATLVGQNLGAAKPERAESAAWIAVRYNVFFLGTVGLLFILFARPIANFFGSDPLTLAYGAQGIWIIGLGFPFYAVGMCLTSAFNGAGDAWTPTWLNFSCLWLFAIPLAWLLADYWNIGATGVFIAIPAAFSTLAIASALVFRKGGWKLQQV